MARTPRPSVPDDSPLAEPSHVYTVSEITQEIKAAIESSVPACWVIGEISNLSRPGSGHIYLTLKDKDAQIGAVLWRSTASRLRFVPQNGQEVLVSGRPSVYPPHGKYQLIVDRIQPRGVGELQLAFQQLKERLEKEGLFEARFKKPIPEMPKRIGVVTSSTGAAIRDILSVLKRRFPAAQPVLYPVRVQGEGSAREIANAIARMSEMGGFDVLIVGRGGGSIEDLWAFNEEVVARAISKSRIPIISAVGHETDFTIADFVADARAPTPTAAAELAVPDRGELFTRLGGLEGSLRSSLLARLNAARLRVQRCADSYALRQPVDLVRQKQQRADELSERLCLLMKRRLEQAQEKWHGLAGVLETLSPLKVLKRGYSVTQKAEDGAVLRSASQVEPGHRIRTILAEGKVVSRIESVEEVKNRG